MKPINSVLILGLAASGEAAARLLLSEGKRICILDENRTETILTRAAMLEKLGANVHPGAATVPSGQFDICVVSPGFHCNSPLLQEVLSRGIAIIPEFELGWTRAGSRVLAITGSNGKSTMVKLCAEALQLSGLQAFPCGNYGQPVSRVVREHPEADWLVIEISSFQLNYVREFHPHIAVLLNVFQNHLDHHRDLETYAAVKGRIFAHMGGEEHAIINELNLPAMRSLLRGKMSPIVFGVSSNADYCFCDNRVRCRATGEEISFAGTLFANDTLGLTAAAASAAMKACGASFSCLENAARVFQPLPHRMEFIGECKGVKFINDSKATNVAALLAALRLVPKPMRLIAGGLPKNDSYAPACALLAEKAKGVYLIGKAAGEMAIAWRDCVTCWNCGTLDNAVKEAWRHSVAGETILLAPACASFDQFRNFEERGNNFRCLFLALKRLPG